MATTPKPQRSSQPGLFDLFSNPWAILRGIATENGFGGTLMPVGNYSGAESVGISKSGNMTITNPWGVAASFGNRLTSLPFNLAAGQSYDFGTGRLSDPNLHPDTARRLNDSVKFRAAGEAGLTKASEDTARNSVSILGTLDQMYWGNQNAQETTSYKLSGISEVAQGGLDQATILGSKAVSRNNGRG